MKSQTAYTFEAVISLLPTELGGRHSGIKSGYRPNFSFNTEMQFCGEIRFENNDLLLMLGQDAHAIIVLIPAHYIRKNIAPDDVFRIAEGKRTIGTGIIKEVLEKKIFNEAV